MDSLLIELKTLFIFYLVYGLTTPSVISMTEENEDQPNTIGIEARKLRCLLMKIMEYD